MRVGWVWPWCSWLGGYQVGRLMIFVGCWESGGVYWVYFWDNKRRVPCIMSTSRPLSLSSLVISPPTIHISPDHPLSSKHYKGVNTQRGWNWASSITGRTCWVSQNPCWGPYGQQKPLVTVLAWAQHLPRLINTVEADNFRHTCRPTYTIHNQQNNIVTGYLFPRPVSGWSELLYRQWHLLNISIYKL